MVIVCYFNCCLYIVIMLGEYSGIVYVLVVLGVLILYGIGDKLIDVKISEVIDFEMDCNIWCCLVNSGGKYMLGKLVWYMFDSC